MVIAASVTLLLAILLAPILLPRPLPPTMTIGILSVVGASVRFQRSYNGKQPGDPAKAAAVLLHIASLSEPPLRMLLGSDCYAAAEKSAFEKLESDRRWRDLRQETSSSRLKQL